jgi:outer membrane protein assembly factor BamB
MGTAGSDSKLGGWEMFRGNPCGIAIDSLAIAHLDTVYWQKKIGGRVYASPIITGGVGVLSALDKRTYFFDVETGEIVGKLKSRAPLVSSPAGVGNLVYLAAERGDGRLRCVNIANRKTIWELKLRDVSAPIITTDHNLYVGNNSGVFYSVNRFTGEVNWEDSIGGAIIGGAAVSDELVFVGSAQGRIRCYRHDGELLWEFDAGCAVMSTPAVSQHCYVTLFDGRLIALDKSSGLLAWSFSTDGSTLGSPVVDDKTVFFGSNDRSFYAVSARDGSLVWKKGLGGICSATPLVASDEIAIGCRDGRLVFLDKLTGIERFVLRTKGRIFSSPVAFGGRIYLATADKLLYCIGSSTARINATSAKTAASLSE